MTNILDSIEDPAVLKKILERIKYTKINVLLIGGTGVGKSSTINALFQNVGKGQAQAKVGQKFDPQTMDVISHELDNLVIWDTPGLGDTSGRDREHQRKIVEILKKSDPMGRPLIDLIFLVLDASSRDFSSAYTLIKEVVLPNLHQDDRKCLLIGINQADMALKGRYWDEELNKPEPKLIDRLDEQVQTVKSRIKDETGLDVEPIYYSAGYKDGDEEQRPYNLQKLMSFILERLPEKKRAAIAAHINKDEANFQSNDGKADYGKKIDDNILDSISVYVRELLDGAYDKAKKFVTDPDNVKAAGSMLATAILHLFKSKSTKGE